MLPLDVFHVIQAARKLQLAVSTGPFFDAGVLPHVLLQMILVEKSLVALRAREVVDSLMSPILMLFQQMHFSERFMTNIAGESSVSVNEGFVLLQIS